MADLKLDIAFWDYDWTRALADGTVKHKGKGSDAVAQRQAGERCPQRFTGAEDTKPDAV